jgi:hypothetical protein
MNSQETNLNFAEMSHLALGEDAPLRRLVRSVRRIAPVPILGGFHH